MIEILSMYRARLKGGGKSHAFLPISVLHTHFFFQCLWLKNDLTVDEAPPLLLLCDAGVGRLGPLPRHDISHRSVRPHTNVTRDETVDSIRFCYICCSVRLAGNGERCVGQDRGSYLHVERRHLHLQLDPLHLSARHRGTPRWVLVKSTGAGNITSQGLREIE